MDWVGRMNRAIDYIEEHLTEGIDPEAVSRILASPYSVFQRAFGPITGIQLSEYIRRRKLSRAARDLREKDMRVIDVAVLYGYESADAFTAAFKRMHGITPQEAKKPDANLKFYPRMTFSLTIIGGAEMDYRVCGKRGVSGGRRAQDDADGAAEHGRL